MKKNYHKKYAAPLPILLAALFIALLNFHCRKGDTNNTDRFCDVQRETYLSVNSQEGMVVHSSKFNRYGVSFAVTTSNTIDAQVIGYTCNLPKELQQVGVQVIASGTLKTFNQNENMKPEIAGQDIYFLAVAQIAKK